MSAPSKAYAVAHEVVALGVGQRDVHAKARQQRDERLRAGERLAVARRIRPGHGHLLAAEVLQAAKLLDEVKHVGGGLGGVVGVGLQGDERGTVVEHAVVIGLVDGLGDLGHVGVALADVHVVADADDVGHEGDHRGGLAHGLAVGDLRLALIEVLELKAQEVRGLGEREARARGVVTEERDGEARVKDARRDVALAEVAQGGGHDVERAQLVSGLVPGVQEVGVVHAGEVVALELVEKRGEVLGHVRFLSVRIRASTGCRCRWRRRGRR